MELAVSFWESLTEGAAPAARFLTAVYFLVIAVGVFVLASGLSDRKATPDWVKNSVIPFPKITGLKRVFVRTLILSVSVLFIAVGIAGVTGQLLRAPTRLRVFASLAENELYVLNDLARRFEKAYGEVHRGDAHGVTVEIVNVSWDARDSLRRLNTEPVDLLIIDVNQRRRFINLHLLKELPDEEYGRLIPPNVIVPALLDALEVEEVPYFLPFRPNVRILFVNEQLRYSKKKECCELVHPKDSSGSTERKPGYMPPLSDVIECAEFLWCTRSGCELTTANDKPPAADSSYSVCERATANYKPPAADSSDPSQRGIEMLLRLKWNERFAIQAKGGDKALFLLEYLRLSGVDPRCVYQESEGCDGKTWFNRKLLKRLWRVSRYRSEKNDWQTATGHLLSDNVDIARNWAFALRSMEEGGRLDSFRLYPGWSLNPDGSEAAEKSLVRPHLLGGDLLAIPEKTRNEEQVRAFIGFLLEHNSQKFLASRLSWPSMLADVEMPEYLKEKGRGDVVLKALNNARPVPQYWSTATSTAFQRVFDAYVANWTEYRRPGYTSGLDNRNDSNPTWEQAPQNFPFRPMRLYVRPLFENNKDVDKRIEEIENSEPAWRTECEKATWLRRPEDKPGEDKPGWEQLLDEEHNARSSSIMVEIGLADADGCPAFFFDRSVEIDVSVGFGAVTDRVTIPRNYYRAVTTIVPRTYGEHTIIARVVPKEPHGGQKIANASLEVRWSFPVRYVSWAALGGVLVFLLVLMANPSPAGPSRSAWAAVGGFHVNPRPGGPSRSSPIRALVLLGDGVFTGLSAAAFVAILMILEILLRPELRQLATRLSNVPWPRWVVFGVFLGLGAAFAFALTAYVERLRKHR